MCDHFFWVTNSHRQQGAKKVIFTACHSGKLKLTFTSPNIISTCPPNVLMSRLISQFFCYLNSSKKFTCPSDKLITEITSPIAKSTSPGLSDTTFFAHWSNHLDPKHKNFPRYSFIVETFVNDHLSKATRTVFLL